VNTTVACHQQFNTGEVAGIAIGTAIAGAVLAALVIMFLVQKQKKKGGYGQRRSSQRKVTSKRQESDYHSPKDQEEASQRVVVPVDWDKILPQPMDDAGVKNEVTNLFQTIKGHVDNFYHSKHVVDETPIYKSAPDSVGPPKPRRDLELQLRLDDPNTRPAAISQLLCSRILDNIDPYGNPERSLLPQALFPILQGITRPDGYDHGEQTTSPLSRVVANDWKPLSSPSPGGEQAQRSY
jgi:hypothetical protein